MPTEARHGFLTVSNGIHVPYQWECVDAAARASASIADIAHVGKLARQLDDNSLWMLTGVDPVTWQQVGTGAAGTLISPYNANTRIEWSVTGGIKILVNGESVLSYEP